MLLDLHAIYKARSEPRLAARLAARLVQSQALERVTAPVFLVHLALWAIMAICLLLSLGAIWLGLTLHWAAMLPAVITVSFGYVAYRIDSGLRVGMSHVQSAAEEMTDRGMNRVLPIEPLPQRED